MKSARGSVMCESGLVVSTSAPRGSSGLLPAARNEPEEAGTPGRSYGSSQLRKAQEESFALSKRINTVHALKGYLIPSRLGASRLGAMKLGTLAQART